MGIYSFVGNVMVRYSMGFIVSLDGSQVLLLCKNRPAFLVGKWTGIGGHIEEGESPVEAMVRECQEECGLEIPVWEQLAPLYRPNAEINMFWARADISQAAILTDEPIQAFTWEEALATTLSDSAEEMVPLVRTLATLAKAPSF